MQQSSRRTLETELNDLKKAKKEAEAEKRALKQSASDARLEVKALREQLAKAEQDMEYVGVSPSPTLSVDGPRSAWLIRCLLQPSIRQCTADTDTQLPDPPFPLLTQLNLIRRHPHPPEPLVHPVGPAQVDHRQACFRNS